MTYQELKDRLSKCELTLEKIKNGTYNSSKENIPETVKKLTILKESLQKQLAEADKGIVYTDDEKKAKDLADDGVNVKLSDEIDEDVKFGIDETKAIARKVGEAVAKAIHGLGDEVAHMKAKDIEPNSFEIYIEYKNDNEDTFSFYINDDTLHLQDFSFDKELTDVGVKPSGEAIVHVDHLANELTKHFKSMNESNISEVPNDMYYIKVKKTDKASQNALQDAVETFYHPVRFADIVDDDGAGNVIFYLHKRDWQEGMEDDIMGNGVQIVDTNMPLSETLPVGQKNVFHHIGIGYLKGFDRQHSLTKDELEVLGKRIVKQLYKGNIEKAKAKFIKEADDKDDYGRPHVDPKGSRTFLEPDEMMPYNRFKKMTQKEDTDVGHQDDEPDMLQTTAYETAQYAAKLVKKLQKYDQHDGEVDFPNWWQAKLILAKDYMQKAFHYLDSEEKQPAIDQLALEENVDKVAGGIPYKREGNKFIISEPLDDATKERIMKRAKEHGHHAAPNQAGGVTIMAKEGKYKSDAQRKAIYAAKAEKENVNEELSDEQRDALEALEDILNQAGDLGNQARDIIADTFPNYLSQGDAYGAFNFGDSSNSYDTTLSSIVQSIYDGDEEEDMDEDNNPVPQGKHIKVDDMQFMHDQIVSRMKMLAKIYKEKGPEATVMLGPNNDREVKVVDTLKILTQKKRELEDALQNKVAGIGKDQELTEGRGDMDAIKRIISDRASDSGFEEREEAAEVIAAIAEEYMLSLKVIQAYMDSDGPVNPHDVNEIELSKKQISKLKDIVKQLKKSVKGHDAQQKYIDKLVKNEEAPGYKHDCAAKVVHEKYGEGTCIPEKHTLVREGDKNVVTHYDVLFEDGKTVLDIPVQELKIITMTEHWHKGYKKKKK